MGTIKHDAIIITSYDYDRIITAINNAKSIFTSKLEEETPKVSPTSIISEPIMSLKNQDYSFFIAPDGSKEGWTTSELANEAREEFINWLDNNSGYDYVAVNFGGDSDTATITAHNKD